MTEELPLASVVIPAHNEQAVIARCLDQLLTGAHPGELDVLVVANACTDETAAAASRPGVRVLRTAVPGKANAIRMGDTHCRTFPRLYLDADVELDLDSVRALVAAARQPGVLACSPAPRWELTGVGPVARRVHKVHDALIAPHRALAGVGAYLLTEQGHERAFPLPDVVSDDGWVHRSFAPQERLVVTRAHSLVRPARTVAAHLRRRVRVRQGNRQLDALGRTAAEGRLRLGSLRSLVTTRVVGPLDAACYLVVMVADKALARRRHTGSAVRWTSDTTSR